MDVIFVFGQVGQALARELRLRGRSVRVVSRSGRGPVLDGVEHVPGDATSPAFCRAMCTGAEVVYLCLNAPYDRWAAELPPLQEAVLAARALATLGEHDEADGRVWHLPSVETRSTREILRLAGRIAGVQAEVSAISPVLLAVLARVSPMVREVRAVGYQLDRSFVVDSSAFEGAFDSAATPLEEALRATVDWYRERAQEPRKRRGAAVARVLGVFALAVLAIRSLVAPVPALAQQVHPGSIAFIAKAADAGWLATCAQ